MEQGTLVGTILAWVLLFVAMCFDFGTFQVNVGNLGYFVDAPSLMIVFGGTIASTFISHTMVDAKGFLGIIGKSWKGVLICFMIVMVLLCVQFSC